MVSLWLPGDSGDGTMIWSIHKLLANDWLFICFTIIFIAGYHGRSSCRCADGRCGSGECSWATFEYTGLHDVPTIRIRVDADIKLTILFSQIASWQKPAAKPAAAPPRFEIKKWNAVAMWSWDICADTVSLMSSPNSIVVKERMIVDSQLSRFVV